MSQTKDHETLSDVNDQVQVRLDKLQKLRGRNENPYKNGFKPTALAQQIHHQYGEKAKEELEGLKARATVAGRIMSIRDFGKSAFVKLKDRSGDIQLYFQKNVLGEEVYGRFHEYDIGDIVTGEGSVFKTKTGELSVSVEKTSLLSKSLRPLPEKYHGISDVEIRYRQRYLDLIMNDQAKEVFLKRSKIVEIIRRYFTDNDFVEVETPMMQSG